MLFLTPFELGAAVREARTKAGLSQTQLGNRIGASRYWVAEFERGKPGVELGLALGALRALGMHLTIATGRAPRTASVPTPKSHHEIDLSAVLANFTKQPYPPDQRVDPMMVHELPAGVYSGAFDSVAKKANENTPEPTRPSRKK